MTRIGETLIRWLAASKLLAVPRKIFAKFLLSAIYAKHGVVIFYGEQERAKVLDLVRRIKKEVKMLLSDDEAYQIYVIAQKTAKLEGDLAEVGTYKGGSAKLICEAKGERALHLFDTFEGLPEINKIDANLFHKGQYSALFEEVKEYLHEYQNVHFYKGLFPKTANSIKNKKFSFVHLDVDIYESTISGLEFFYPRMNRGGIIVCHDYINSAGVKKAVDEFFKDKPELVLEISRWQCLIVKV